MATRLQQTPGATSDEQQRWMVAAEAGDVATLRSLLAGAA
ncbi:hypothetical protein PF005_g30184 [Phytophthora fragariae]|uniref:Uncharacterized protein n=1 Tax=Phytophthora fragariae TaxID=53985 RepID=A0A6A3PWY8_9STRA|nr:hypothetical protein PF009_g30502 [Phytophthora fragariae]KAE9061359.1 hypothetical protein PF010_g29846 [Phytophthora fragariae]KAE9062330.1 hypothetical protein PF007_g29949 [Phytophthora fragariae]KAE9067759.1 hypothetical protein PF006_g29930 [Phytophthora fragariae]KAE9164060.1 hypothetical protein PF005_g30184 [Phytophthora fragariae]